MPFVVVTPVAQLEDEATELLGESSEVTLTMTMTHREVQPSVDGGLALQA